MLDLEFIRNAGETKRFHTWPVLRTQNVAEHSWHVAMLLWYIFGSDEPGITMPLMMAALTHDAAEWQVGDIPSSAKRRMAEMGFEDFRAKWGEMEQKVLNEFGWDWEGYLSDEELQKLKLVDSMDGAFYCVRERAMGNKLITPCYENFISYVEEVLMASFPISVSHSDRHIVAAERETTNRAREVYAHIKDMWEQANAS